jgi:hypothetical protein
MHKITQQLRKNILSNYDDSYDRIRSLKGTLKGETVYILAPGPSLKYVNASDLSEALNGKFTIALKQAYSYIPQSVDLQIINFCNLDDYTYNSDCMVGWTVWNAQQPYEIINSGFRCDFILDTYKLGDGSPRLENTIAFTGDFDKMSMDYTLSRPWGPGTMYEVAIPLAVYMGCSEIVTIGWDLFGKKIASKLDDSVSLQDTKHYAYDNLKYKQTETRPSLREAEVVVESTSKLNQWLKKQNVTLTIVDPQQENPASSDIQKRTHL